MANGEACATIYTDGAFTAATCGPAEHCGTSAEVDGRLVEVVCADESQQTLDDDAEDATVVEYVAIDWALWCDRDTDCYRGESCAEIFSA